MSLVDFLVYEYLLTSGYQSAASSMGLKDKPSDIPKLVDLLAQNEQLKSLSVA